MYTYHHVISRLTEAQKIRLLTDLHSLSDPELQSLGVPRVESASLREDGCTYPSLVSLARSWEPSLLRKVSEILCRAQASKGSNHLLLPPAGSALYSDGIRFSEDSFLSGSMAGAVLAGANDVGVSATLTGYGFSRADAPHMDTPPSESLIYEHLTAPYTAALQGGSCKGIILEDSEPAPAGLASDGYTILRRDASEKETVTFLYRGELLLHGSASALQRAVYNYRSLKNAIDHGKATTGELEEAIAEGEAMDEETLNCSLDRLLCFAAACVQGTTASLAETPTAVSPDQALRAATVLLKNHSDLLPLRTPAKICLLGDWGDSDTVTAVGLLLTAGGHTLVGHAPGYAPDGGRNDSLTHEAATLAATADLLLVALHARGCSRLPAEQLALTDALSRLGKRTVIVLSADRSVDMDFVLRASTPPEALLLLPENVEGSSRHAVETVLGLRSPEGRLTHALIDPSDPAAHRTTKVGSFVGYRYYDTLGCGTVYPFGYGLTYTHFRYSHLKVTGSEITLTVKNVGKRAGIAVPQLYVGLRDSAIPRPKKVLTAFTRITLAPGEASTVTLPLHIPPVAEIGGLTEQGLYTLFVGESVFDIRLTATVPAGNTLLPPGKEPLSAYIPVTNIPTEHYTLEAEYRPMKSTVRNTVFGISALVLAASVKIYDIVTSSGSVFLNIVAALMAVGAICFFILEMRDRKKQFAQARTELEEATAALFEEADNIPVPSADALFETAARVAAQEAQEEEEYALSNGVDHFRDVDRELTLPIAVSAVTTLAAEEGLAMEETAVRGILAAMLSSRLILVKDTDTQQFQSVCSLLGTYFGCPVTYDAVDESYADEASLLFGADENGNSYRRNAAVTIEAARRDLRTIHLVTLTDVTAENLSTYFVPYARYARAPLTACAITTRMEDGSNAVYRLPENLWFVLHLRDGERLDLLPDYVAEVAAVQTWRAEYTRSPAGEHSEFAPFRYGQMLYLCDRIRSETVTDEDVWKRIDRLESYGRRYGDFRMGNKLWVGMETYFSMLRACGATTADALDESLAVMMLPALIAALSGKLPKEERGLSETLEVVLGDGNADLCRKTVKESGAELI